MAVAQPGEQLLDSAVVLPDLGQGARGPLVVLLPVGGELRLPPALRGLRREPVLLVAGAGLFLGPVAAGAEVPAARRRVIAGRVGHRHRGGEGSRRELRYPLGAPQRGGGERGGAAAVGEQAGQGGDAGVQLLGPPPGVGLALLPVGRLPLTVHPRHGAFGVPCLPFLVALLLCSRAALGFLLALLLTLRLGPDGH